MRKALLLLALMPLLSACGQCDGHVTTSEKQKVREDIKNFQWTSPPP